MKPSFYLVLWILVYVFLGWLDIPVVSANAFVSALMLVLAVSWILKRPLRSLNDYQAVVKRRDLFEIIYSRNYDRAVADARRNVNISWAAAFFMAVTVAMLSGTGPDVAGIVIFSLLAVLNVCTARNQARLLKKLRAARRRRTDLADVIIPDAALRSQYEVYAHQRASTTFAGMMPKAPLSYHFLCLFQAFFALVCIGLSMLTIGYVLRDMWNTLHGTPEQQLLWVILSAYSGLALYYGIRDLKDIVHYYRWRSKFVKVDPIPLPLPVSNS